MARKMIALLFAFGLRASTAEDTVIVGQTFMGTMQAPICSSLSAVGIKCNAIMTMDGDRDETDDWSEVVARLDEGDFDLLLWAQNTLPAGDPAWFLNAFFRSDGGNNHAGLNSSTVDALIDTMSDEDDHDDRVSACADAHAAILADVAVSNLVTPEWHVALSDKMLGDDAYPNWDGYTPWGSDYYASAVPKSYLQPDLNVRVLGRFGPDSSTVLRELDESNRFAQKSAESTSI